jgi:DNA-binding transcriptional MerR regulator
MDEMMHIGRLAALAGTTTRTVRYYEEMGLVQPEDRSPGGFRRYSRDQLERLRVVLSLKRLEFDLEHIKRIMDKRDGDPTGGVLASDILSDLKERLADVERQIGHLHGLREDLRQTVETLCRCQPCERRLADRPCSQCRVIRQEADALPFFHATPVS